MQTLMKILLLNEAIILSMTKKERENPEIISGSRRRRISLGQEQMCKL